MLNIHIKSSIVDIKFFFDRRAFPCALPYEANTITRTLFVGIAMVEAQNISAYIPTNLISITDGQVYLSPLLFQKALKNIADRLDDLRMSYRQQRQSLITEELMDVISGFEALTVDDG